MKWFRFYNEFIEDPKVSMMSDTDQLLWVKALCLASGSAVRGVIMLTDDEIAWKLRIAKETWQSSADKFRAKGMLEHSEQGYKISQWDNRQFESDSSAKRVSKHRAKQVTPKKQPCNVTATPPDTDTDPDTDPKPDPKPEKRVEVFASLGGSEQPAEMPTEPSKPIDLVAERYRSRRLAGRNSDFEKAWTAWQRGRAACKLNPDSGKESAQNAWVLRFPTGEAPSDFFADLDAYWTACKRNIEAKKFLPIPGFIKFLGDISYLEAALGESSTTTNPEIEILKTWGDRQDWENFPLLAEWQAKCEEIGWVEFTNLGGRYSPQHRFADWHRGTK